MKPIPYASERDPGRAGLRRGIALYREGEFFEAHEVLEDAWRELTGVERLLYQALIQVAMGCRKVRQEKWNGARLLFQRALDKLEPHSGAFPFLPLDDFTMEVAAILAWVEARQRGERADSPPILPVLPELP